MSVAKQEYKLVAHFPEIRGEIVNDLAMLKSGVEYLPPLELDKVLTELDDIQSLADLDNLAAILGRLAHRANQANPEPEVDDEGFETISLL